MPISRDAVLNKLKLRTQPFFPEIGPDNQPLNRASLQKALDPREDERIINYYYDVYDWSESTVVRGLTAPPVGLQSFPAIVDPDRPLLVIVSGTRSSGRDSLINLILRRIQQLHGTKPRVLTISDLPRSTEPAVKDVANFFIASWPPETQEALEKIFARFTKEKSTDTDVHYPALFYGLREAVKGDLTMPSILSITGTDSYDIWKSLYLSCRKLFDYIIVQTKSPRAANTCKMSMPDTIVAHIQAQPLSKNGAFEYAKTRISFERREAATDDLEPFTKSGIDLLYEPGRAAQPGEQATKTIGWLRETLRSALEKHVEKLIKRANEKNLDDLETLAAADLLVAEETIWDARQEINRGQR